MLENDNGIDQSNPRDISPRETLGVGLVNVFPF